MQALNGISAVRTLPLEGGGQGGGESVELNSHHAALYDLTPPLTPPPLGAGGGWQSAT